VNADQAAGAELTTGTLPPVESGGGTGVETRAYRQQDTSLSVRKREATRLERASALPAPSDVPRREILGIPIAMTDYAEAMDVMDGMVARRERGYVCAVAVHAVMVSQHDEEMRRAVTGSTLTVPDGMPLVWAANLLGEDLRNRVYGPELMDRYCARSAERGHRIWLYGGRDQGSLMQLALNLRRRHPGIEIVGGYSPPFRPLTGEEEDAIVEQINEAQADVVWVGVGVPKQEKWMAHMRSRLEAPVLCGVGAAFDFHAGRISQAPPWMQERGLEWIYRIAQEPRRLLPRYLSYNPQFVAAFARQLVRERLARARS
jgi:N-acetylglucosaminyldiphosphoundecaprenol N-acetyl-beta-D-mannosaminyltransferase